MKIHRKKPLNLQDSDKWIFDKLNQVDLPAPFLEHRNYALLLENGVLLNYRGVCLESLLYNSRLQEHGFLKRNVKQILKSLFFFNVSISNTNHLRVSIINEWTTNYFHWITEALPRIIYAKEEIENFILVLPEKYLQQHYVVDSLKILEVKVEIFKSAVFLKKVFIPSRQAAFPAHYNPDYIKKVNSEIINKCNLEYNLGNRIFISRRNAVYRKIANEDEVISLVSKYGFEIVDFEKLTFSQQVSVTYNADFLMSIHGAGLTNMLFCNEGTVIYELSLENQFLDKCYYTLADACNHKYYYQFCKSTNNSESYYSSDIVVDIFSLERNLDNLLQSRF